MKTLLLLTATAAATTVNTCPETSSKTLNIHIVPHTHDDVGWLKTVDQYYYGLNNTIQQAHVSLILDNVHQALLDTTSHNRTFTYVETAFFSKWYLSLSPSKQSSIKSLVASKQLNFANGGWCMHDEATTHYMGMIDQTTLGHDFLLRELGVVPSVGWQIDPFGHSATQGGLLTRDVGFDAVYFGRIHYMELENRQKDGECEGFWESLALGSDDYEEKDRVFWGLTGSFSGNYGAPEGFCFDVLCHDDPLVGLEEETLQKRIEQFLVLMKEQASRTQGKHIMLTMGMDFQYMQARKNYQNLDLLIDATNHFLKNDDIDINAIFGESFEKVEIYYSTPEKYTQCKNAEYLESSQHRESLSSDLTADFTKDNIKVASRNQVNWKVKTGDFFPYADCDHCYWTGYFTSRQGLKRLERVGSSYLHAARQIQSMRDLQGKVAEIYVDGKLEGISDGESSLIPPSKTWNESPLYMLDDAMGIAQHHDAVAGTSKQHVAYDYAKRISKGMSSATSFVVQAIRDLLLDDDARSQGLLNNLSYCHLLNETICEVSQIASRDETQSTYVIVYNALSRGRSEVISIPVSHTDGSYVVERLINPPNEWQKISSTLIPNANYANIAESSPVILYLEATELPPVGASIFRINQQGNMTAPDNLRWQSLSHSLLDRSFPLLRATNMGDTDEDIVISNGAISVHFDRSSGVIKTITDESSGVQVGIVQTYGYYKSYNHSDLDQKLYTTPIDSTFNVKGNGLCLPGYIDSEGNEMPWLLGSADQWQNSGAYIFRPSDNDLHTIPPKVASIIVYETELLSEVHVEFGADQQPTIKQITRLVKGKSYVEVEYVVSPVPVEDGIGKEIVSRYSTNIDSGDTFFTDSNGREFTERTRGENKLYGSLDQDPVAIEPISGNYYPVNAAIYIEDESSSFSVLVDRSQGVSSLSNGSVELMIHRRLLHDDARGVAEALNETDVGITPNPPYGNATRIGEGIAIKGIHRLMIGQGKLGAERARSNMDEIFSQPHIFVSSTSATQDIHFKQASIAALEVSLPENVLLITFVSLREEGMFLVRLAHQYGPHESRGYSIPVEVDLGVLFPSKTITSITEKTLSANQNRNDWENNRLHWSSTAKKLSDFSYTKALYSRKLKANVIVLKPLEIRTYEVRVS